MTAHVRVSGAFQELSEVHVRVSGVWQPVTEGWLRTAGGWEQFYTSGPQVSPSSADVAGADFSGPIYAGVQFNSDGTEYKTNTTGGISYNTSLGAWLDSGLNSEVWVQWHRTGGSLGDWNSDDSGDTRLVLSTSRQWRITSSSGTRSIIGYFEFWDAVSGGNLLHTTGSRIFTADVFT